VAHGCGHPGAHPQSPRTRRSMSCPGTAQRQPPPAESSARRRTKPETRSERSWSQRTGTGKSSAEPRQRARQHYRHLPERAVAAALWKPRQEKIHTTLHFPWLPHHATMAPRTGHVHMDAWKGDRDFQAESKIPRQQFRLTSTRIIYRSPLPIPQSPRALPTGCSHGEENTHTCMWWLMCSACICRGAAGLHLRLSSDACACDDLHLLCVSMLCVQTACICTCWRWRYVE